LKNLVILQARMSSSRLPGKVLAEINGQPMIFWQLQRIARAEGVDGLVVATSIDSSDDELAFYLKNLGVEVSRGPLTDVVSRYAAVLKQKKCDYFIRLTGDCPLIMPELISEMVSDFENHPADYYSNTLNLSYPDGLDTEFISTSAFARLQSYDLNSAEREHVTLGIYSRPEIFSLRNRKSKTDLKDHRWTVDTRDDLNFVRKVFEFFRGRESVFSIEELLKAQTIDPSLVRLMPR